MESKLKRIKKLYNLFQQGKIPTLLQHEVHPDVGLDSRENYLYFTLPPCINFQRNSPAMWKSAFATWQDSKTHYLFFPEQVFQQNRSKIQKHLLKHKLALQQNKHTDIWIAISKTLNKSFENDPRKLLANADYDIVKILQLVQKDRKKDFTHLSGPKMTNYWLMILNQYTNVKFKNIQEISIIPDTHVLQCSIKLGIATAKMNSIEVSKAWKKLLDGSNIKPVQMHPVLWNWSRNNFLPSV